MEDTIMENERMNATGTTTHTEINPTISNPPRSRRTARPLASWSGRAMLLLGIFVPTIGGLATPNRAEAQYGELRKASEWLIFTICHRKPCPGKHEDCCIVRPRDNHPLF